MKSITTNESGVAYGYAIMLLVILLCGIFWVVLSIPVNYMTDSMNEAVAGGDVSEQSASAYDWAVRVYTWILPIGILGAVAMWGLTRANRTDGDM